METRTFMAGKRVQVFSLASMCVWAAFTLLMGLYRGWSPFLFIPAVLTIVYALIFLRSKYAPVFLLSDEALVLCRKGKEITASAILDVRESGKEQIELILKDNNPLKLLMHELSADDQGALKAFLRKIAQKNSTATRI